MVYKSADRIHDRICGNKPDRNTTQKVSRLKNKYLFAFEKQYNWIIHNTVNVNPKLAKYQYHL